MQETGGARGEAPAPPTQPRHAEKRKPQPNQERQKTGKAETTPNSSQNATKTIPKQDKKPTKTTRNKQKQTHPHKTTNQQAEQTKQKTDTSTKNQATNEQNRPIKQQNHTINQTETDTYTTLRKIALAGLPPVLPWNHSTVLLLWFVGLPCLRWLWVILACVASCGLIWGRLGWLPPGGPFLVVRLAWMR